MIHAEGKECSAPKYVIFEKMGDNTSLPISEETLEGHDDMEDKAKIVRDYEADTPSILGDDDNCSCRSQYGEETMKVDNKIADFAIGDNVQSTHEFSRKELHNVGTLKDSQVDCSIGNHLLTTTELDSNPSGKIQPASENIQRNYEISDTVTEDQSLRKDEFDQNNVRSDGDQEKDNIKGLLVHKICPNSFKFRSKCLAIKDEDSMRLNIKIQPEDNGHENRIDIVVSTVSIKLRDELQQKEVDVTEDEGNTLHVESIKTCPIIGQVNLLEPKICSSIIESSVIKEASKLEEKSQSRGEFQQDRIELEVEQENNHPDNQSGDKVASNTSQHFSKPVLDPRSTKMSIAKRLCGLTVEKRNLLRGEIENEELSLSDTLILLENPAPVFTNSVTVPVTASSSRDQNTGLKEKPHSEPLPDDQSLKGFLGNEIHPNSTPLEDAQKALKLLELIKSKKKSKKMKLSRDSETISLISEEIKREKNACKPEKVDNASNYTENNKKNQNDDMTFANTLGSGGSFDQSSKDTSSDTNFSNIYQADGNLKNRSTEFHNDQENNALPSPAKINSKELLKPENTTLNETIAATCVLLSPADHQDDTLKQKAVEKMEIQVNARTNRSTHNEEEIKIYTANSQLKNFFPVSMQHRSTEELSDKDNTIFLSNEKIKPRVIELRKIWKSMKDQQLRNMISWREAIIAELSRRKGEHVNRKMYSKTRRNDKYLTILEKRLTEITKAGRETLALKAEQDALAFKAEQDRIAQIKAKRKKLKALRKVCVQLNASSSETITGLTQSLIPQSPLALDNKKMLTGLQEKPRGKWNPNNEFSSSSSIYCSLREEKLELREQIKNKVSEYTSTPPTAICQATLEHPRGRMAGKTEKSPSTDKYYTPEKNHLLEEVETTRRHSTESIANYSSLVQLDEPKSRKRKRSSSRNDEANNSYFNEPPSTKSKAFFEKSPNSSDVSNKLEKLRTGFIQKRAQMMDNRELHMEATILQDITPSSFTNRHRDEKVGKIGTRTSTEVTPLNQSRKTISNTKKSTAIEVIDLTDD